MKRTSLTVLLSVCAILVMLIVAALPSASSSPVSRNLTSAQQAQPTPQYTVRIYQNRLAICKGTSQQPWKLTSIHVDSLRHYDQQLMQKGFPLYSEQELTVFLEDYGS